MIDDVNSDLGLELLMNPKKKSADALSIVSSNSDAGQHRLVTKGGYASRDLDITSEDDESMESGDGDVNVGRGNASSQFIDVRAFRQQQTAPSVTSQSNMDSGLDDDLDDDEESDDMIERIAPQAPSPASPKIRTSTSFDKRSSCSSMSYQQQSVPEMSRAFRQQHRPSNPMVRSEDDVLDAKRELLYKFERLEKKGMKLPKKFTLASSLEDMKMEFERIKNDREIDNSVKFQRKTMITVVSGVELLNSFFGGPARLEGWSDSINDNIDEYDDVFEELHEKYKGKAKMAPEVKLLLMVGASGLMYHMTNNIAKNSAIPGLDQVLKENPELARQVAAATAKTMASNPHQQHQGASMMSGLGGILSSFMGGGGGGIGNLMSSMMGIGGGGGVASSSPTNMNMNMHHQSEHHTTNMKGPSNVEDILRDLDNDRIEVMSTLTGSDLTEFADDASINNLLMNQRGKSRGKRTLEI